MDSYRTVPLTSTVLGRLLYRRMNYCTDTCHCKGTKHLSDMHAQPEVAITGGRLTNAYRYTNSYRHDHWGCYTRDSQWLWLEVKHA